MIQEKQNTKCPRAALVLGGFMIAIAAVLVGGYGASQLTANYLLDQQVDRDARDVRKQLSILGLLHAGDHSQAIELLEARLDDQLVLFDPQQPYAGLDEQTMANVRQAILEAKTYRLQYPRSSSRPHVDAMVNNLFNKTHPANQ
jgi:hypothetical protein